MVLIRIQLDPIVPLLPRIDLQEAEIMMKESNRYGDHVVTEIGELSSNVIYDACPVSTVAHCVFIC